jgi:RimJ/RimL family protein N-acetyltransferase
MRDVVTIETDRLILRRPVLGDARRISALTSDPNVARMVARVPLPHPPIAAEGFLLILRARERLGEDHVFAVELPGEGLIGLIGAHARGGGAFEVGYWFGRPYWGRGYATEALRAFVKLADALGGLEAGHFVDNPASGRVLEKAGFAYTGETEACFSLARGAKAPSRRMRRVRGAAPNGDAPRESVAAH